MTGCPCGAPAEMSRGFLPDLRRGRPVPTSFSRPRTRAHSPAREDRLPLCPALASPGSSPGRRVPGRRSSCDARRQAGTAERPRDREHLGGGPSGCSRCSSNAVPSPVFSLCPLLASHRVPCPLTGRVMCGRLPGPEPGSGGGVPAGDLGGSQGSRLLVWGWISSSRISSLPVGFSVELGSKGGPREGCLLASVRSTRQPAVLKKEGVSRPLRSLGCDPWALCLHVG